jgi:NADH:ubiquinone oxidoreductase subunit 5 (subunit L)/multisubunit Na+/H+ antiporter MnhA subunit
VNTTVPWLVWILPMIGAIVAVPASRISRRVGTAVAVIFPLLAAVAASAMIPDALNGGTVDLQVQWIPSLGINAGVLIDPLSVLMSNVVAWVSFLIVVYSIGYMRNEATLTRYWFFINYFIGNMLLLVLSDNLLQLMFGWEGVGLCSYALIGYWYSDEPDKWVGSEGDCLSRYSSSTRVQARSIWWSCRRTLAGQVTSHELGCSCRPGSCCFGVLSGSRLKCRCMNGCLTRWPAPRRFLLSSMPPRW